MSNRREYEGEEDLQLLLLDVTQDPTFGKHTLQHNKVLLDIHNKMESGKSDEVLLPTAKVVH